MTAISETAPNLRHRGIWRRSTQALGKLWVKMITLPDASAWPKTSWPEYFNFPPF
jgi:hypothetical protein